MADQDQRADAVGKRVQVVRKLRGLTQEQLANRAHLSVSLIKKVETGRKAASPYFVATVAHALRVSVPELYGRPTPRYGTERADVADLETAIMAGPVIAADGPPYSLDELAARSRDLVAVGQRAQYDQLASEVPTLLADTHNAVASHVGDDRRRAWRILAETYNHAAGCLYRLGSDVVAHAADAGMRAAEHGDDPVLASVILTEKCLPLMQRGAYDHVSYLCHEARLTLDTERCDTMETRSARGYAHLRSAIVAARTGDPDTATGHLDEARRLAEQIPRTANLHATSFNSANVDVHAVAAAVEAGNGREALRRARPLGPGLSAVRHAHHHVDLSRAHLLVGDREGTLSALYAARDAAPQMTRYHPQVHETVRVLAETDRRRSDSLAGFARWAGIAV